MILRPLFCFKDKKNTGLVIFNSLKQNKLIFNFFLNRNWTKLTDSRKRAKILPDNRKSHHPIETLLYCLVSFPSFILRHFVIAPIRDTIQTTLQLYSGPSPGCTISERFHEFLSSVILLPTGKTRKIAIGVSVGAVMLIDCTRYLYCLLR